MTTNCTLCQDLWKSMVDGHITHDYLCYKHRAEADYQAKVNEEAKFQLDVQDKINELRMERSYPKNVTKAGNDNSNHPRG